jgi:pyridoxine 5'-phosphate synthase PdxJ
MFRPHEAIISPNKMKEITTLHGLTRQYYHAVIACHIWEISARSFLILKYVFLKFIFPLQMH